MKISEVREDIKTMLTGGVVRLEISDETIDKLINRAYKKIKPYATDKVYITVQPARVVDLTQHKVLEVIRLFPTVQMSGSASEDSDTYFDFQVYKTLDSRVISAKTIAERYSIEDYSIPFHFDDGKLYIAEGYTASSVTAECFVERTLEELEDERVCAWIMSYSEALCKEVVGRIRSKFRSSNIPIEFDGETLLNEAQSEKERLESELTDKDFGPFLIMR